MTQKEIRIECPCCHSRLEVDVLTEKVMRVLEQEGQGSRHSSDGSAWTAAEQRVTGRARSAADRLEQSLEREKGKSKDLDELFRKAKEKLSQDPDEEVS